MKDRNHLAQVTTVADVNIIDNGIIDIPMLQILDENGKATPEETSELLEEGIEVATIPWVDKSEN